ncbi:MAG: hypothetical protein OEZ08_01335 [Betaproteobacteria bacterium]|nr:hypothetical protein [Betaproteobacteria bacterium]
MPELPGISVPTLLSCGDPARFAPEILIAEMRKTNPAAGLQHYADQLDGRYHLACAGLRCAFPSRRASPHRLDLSYRFNVMTVFAPLHLTVADLEASPLGQHGDKPVTAERAVAGRCNHSHA